MTHPSFTFIWSIKNFSLCEPWITNNKIKSEFFYFPSIENKYQLHVCPRGQTMWPNHVELELFACSSIEPITIDCELSFLSADDSPLVKYRNTCRVNGTHICWMANSPTQEEVFLTKRSVFLPEDVLKVQCRFWQPIRTVGEPIFVYSTGCLLLINKFTTAFTIPNLSKVRMGEKKSALSPLPIGENQKIELELLILGSGKMEKADVHFQVSSNIVAICRLTIVNEFGESAFSRENTSVLIHEGTYLHKFVKFTTRQKLLDRNKTILHEGVLVLICEFLESKYVHLREDTEDTREDTHNSSTEFPALPMLQDDLLSLYKEHKFSDFELRTEGTSFPVHKNILAARSPVFRALFSSDMKEVVSGFQDVPDINKKTLDQMLLFVYTDIVQDLQWEETTNLYYVADKYQILRLKEKCSSCLQAKLDCSNVCEILELADRHNDQALKLAVEDFLLDHAEEIMMSEEWILLKNRNSQLAADTMCKMFSMLTITRK